MGPCLSKKHTKDTIIQQHFKKDIPLPGNSTLPLFTTLYNLLRKNKQLEIINKHSQTKPLFQNETNPRLTQLTNSDMKMLYNFKVLIWIGETTEDLKTIQNSTNLKELYQIKVQYADNFLGKYPIFRSNSAIRPKTIQIPLLIFSSQQLIPSKQKSNSNKQLFLHTQNHINQQIYTSLKINQQISQQKLAKTATKNTNTNTNNNIKTIQDTIVHKLSHSTHNRTVYLHSQNKQQNQLLTILTKVIMQKYQTDELSTKIYLKRFLLHTQLLSNNNNQQVGNISNNQSIAIPIDKKQQSINNKKNNDNLPIQQQQAILLYKLYKQIGGNKQAANKVQRAYNLLITLLSNIYSNRQTADNYRKVRKTNKQINQMLGKYKYGIRLLKVNGFEDLEGFYVNNMDGKYLKIYRTDLEVAYRHYIDQKDQE